LYEPSNTAPDDIRDRVDAFLEKLKDEPIPLVIAGNSVLLTHYILRISLHTSLYLPNLLWPLLAQWLQVLASGDLVTASSIIETGELWQHQKHRGFSPSLPPIPHLLGFPHMSLQDSNENFQYGYAWQTEASVAILCGDGDDITGHTKANHTDYLALLESQSELSAPIWAEIILHCIHWPQSLRPSSKNRFTGPFGSKLSDYNSKGSPILFIGNTADPVTPVYNAHKMSEGHEGSVVLTQDVPGHCSTENNPSTCLFAIVRAFFANGTLPERDLVCGGIWKPWDLV